MFDSMWHKEENAVYELDNECMKKSGKLNLVQNYFELLLCIFFS